MKAAQKIGRVVTVYVLWLLAVGAGFLILVRLYNTLNLAWPIFGGDPFVLRGVARVYIVIAGAAWMVYIFVTEWYFQRSFPSPRPSSVAEVDEGAGGEPSGLGLLLRRFAIALSLPLGLLIVDAILRWVAFGILRG